MNNYKENKVSKEESDEIKYIENGGKLWACLGETKFLVGHLPRRKITRSQDNGGAGAMNYLLQVEYRTQPTDRMYSIDADLSAIALGRPAASGYGCGFRDHEWVCSTKEEAESLAEEMREFLISEKIEHTIEIELEEEE